MNTQKPTKAAMNRARQDELGIEKARWRHSGGGKHPRPTHVANDGKTYDELPQAHTSDRSRSAGVADMAYSILRRERAHRASGELAQHVVEIMEAFEKSSTTGRHITLTTTCARPAAVPASLAPNELDS